MPTTVWWIVGSVTREILMGRKKTDRVANIKIGTDVAQMARLVASRRGISMAEYLTELLRGPVSKDWLKIAKEMTEGVENHG
jgi:hypothetical protein